MDAEFSLKDKVAIITGAASGIGSETAKLFTKLGATLSLMDTNENGLLKTADFCKTINTSNKEPFVLVGDVSDEKFQETLIEDSATHFGRLDILINNAGILLKDTFEKPDLAVFDKVLKVNLRAPYNLIALAVPHLKKTKGCIVNTASCTSNENVMGDLLSYSISKAAVDKVTQMAASELGVHGIRVNSVRPGPVATPMFDELLPTENADEVFEAFASQAVLNRIAQPLDVAKSIAFLASDYANYITGVNLLVDGGRSVRSFAHVKF